MIFKKLSVLLLFSLLFLLGGCSTSFKANWANFNAYFNTFYNANKSYKTGLKKNLDQPREYNPLQPIRIHQVPVNAGTQDFENAIAKAADILRKHDDTKWVDDALFLIGKSYYYRQEYFSAEQKFQELYITTSNQNMIQQAVFWRGRVLLDMNRHGEAVAYLIEQMDDQSIEWTKNNIAEARTILAQHYIGQENWSQAAVELESGIPDLKRKEYRERGYFLLGQVYEELGRMEEAFDAYNSVNNNFHEYRLQYLAKRKQAEVARNLGRHGIASSLFNEMIRDDKNLDYKSELDFELARTEQRRGNYQNAETLYKNLLRNTMNPPPPEIAARTYYGLAEIYRHNYNNFQLAAAYYDSAAKRNVPAERLPEGFDATTLAQSFGNYSQLKTEVAFLDSMLWLASLSPMEFDSVIAQVRTQKIAEIRQMRVDEESRQNTLVNIEQQPENVDATSLRNGFLNANNLLLQQNAKLQFLAVWGDRPLADNWRVARLISNTASENENGGETSQGAIADNLEAFSVSIDISRVPFSKAQQDSVKKQIAAYQYQLGNLFFLSLNMPDSAGYYFEKAVENPSIDNVTIVSLYSLSELYAMQGDAEKASEYAHILMKNFPDTEYAQRLAADFDMELEQTEHSKKDPLSVYLAITEDDSLPGLTKADYYKKFSSDFREHILAAEAQWQAVQIYMNLGKSNPGYNASIKQWVEVKRRWQAKQAEFSLRQDSAKIMLNDTTLTPELQLEFEQLVDSSLAEPDFSEYFPYYGVHWDSTRSAIDLYLTRFPDSKYDDHVSILKRELELPEKEDSKISDNSDAEKVENYKDCGDIDAQLNIRGGKEEFLTSVMLPEDVEISEITYRFFVNEQGNLDHHNLLTENVSEELIQKFDSALSEITFQPILENNEEIAVQCEMSFQLN